MNVKKTYTLVLPIRPVPKREIKTRYGRQKGYYDNRYAEYRKSLFVLIRSELQDHIKLADDEAITVDIKFCKNAIYCVINIIKKDDYRIKRPDLDNLIKPFLDELKIAIGVDDSKIVKITASKYDRITIEEKKGGK
jgi:Holliday junction resolvase RusA-like endonuclease